MFDNNDKETIKDVSKDIINTTNDIINTNNDIINIDDDWIEDNLFDNDDEETTNDVSDDIINTTNDIINIDDNFPMETIVISDDVCVCVCLRPSTEKASSVWIWNSRGQINDVVLNMFLSSAKFLHRLV